MSYVIPAPKQPAIAVAGTDATFPVRRIWCVGRNYADHAREMGHDPNREPPFFFQKPSDAVVASGSTLPYPAMTKDLHHEIELVVAIGKGGTNIPVAKALEHVFGYGVGLDMTRRDLQQQAKDLKRPWEMGKSFDQSCPVTPLVPAAKIGHPNKGAIWVKVNGEVKQQRRPQPADLAGRGDDRLPLAVRRARAGRPHPERHAGRRRSVQGGRQARGPRRRRGRPRDHLRRRGRRAQGRIVR